MKIPKDKNQKLSHVDKRNRVFIYDASIVIKFLEATFFSFYEIAKPECYRSVGVGTRITPDMLVDGLEVKHYDIHDVYDFYVAYRNSQQFTADIESRYKFIILMKKMTLSKNGWQFNILRSGRAQVLRAYPLVLRSGRKAPNPIPFKDMETEEAETSLEIEPDDFDDTFDKEDEVFIGENDERAATIRTDVDIIKSVDEHIFNQIHTAAVTDFVPTKPFVPLAAIIATPIENSAVESPPRSSPEEVPEAAESSLSQSPKADPGLTDLY